MSRIQLLEERILILVVAIVGCQSNSHGKTIDYGTASKSHVSSPIGLACDFETKCSWEWTPPSPGYAGFNHTTFAHIVHLAKTEEPGTFYGAGPIQYDSNVTNKHLLFLSLRPGVSYTNPTTQIRSPWYKESGEQCYLEADFLLFHFKDTEMPLKILIETMNNTGWAEIENLHNEVEKAETYSSSWKHAKIPIGRLVNPFRLIIEVQLGHIRPAYVALDNLKLTNCITDVFSEGEDCTGVRCDNDNRCVKRDHICDINKDCLNGEDERFCGRIPEHGFCDFEGNRDCGWKNLDPDNRYWRVHQGATEKDHTGPSVDHTYGNETGYYMLSELPHEGVYGERGILISPLLPPPPCYHRTPESVYYKTCKLRFYYHKLGKVTGSTLVAEVVDPDKPKAIHTLLNTAGNKGNRWNRFVGTLPTNLEDPYQIRILNFRGARSADIGIDDISLAPECFGIGVSEDEIKICPPPKPTPTNEYHPNYPTTTYKPPIGKTVYVLSTCGATGHKGPTGILCHDYYKTLSHAAPIIHSSATLQGLQTWKVPKDGYYTIIAKGASGGSGVQTQSFRTRGAIAKGIFVLKKDTDLHVVVGQEGISACQEHMMPMYKLFCEKQSLPPEDMSWRESGVGRLIRLRNKTLPGGAGGGGGASFVFKKIGDEMVPLVIGAGGGGLAWSSAAPFTLKQHGRAANLTYEPVNGNYIYNGTDGAGPGGGLAGRREGPSGGASLKDGAEGGAPCSAHWASYGGFGGGGGGCLAGGGGGGYAGGDSDQGAYRHGEGGISFTSGINPQVKPASNIGPGFIFIIPATNKDCGCEHLCIHLDEKFIESICLCPENKILADDGVTCINHPYGIFSEHALKIVLGILLIFLLALLIAFFCYYRNKRQDAEKASIDNQNAIQLRRIREATGMMVSEYNPNYEFGGGPCSIKDLKEIPRENLSLVKALGQGAFGEVYKGYLKSYVGDSVELPVAVKTLPEITNSLSSIDFIMEAAIMSKFNHPNIVHFIGVCFDKLPQFIILELLSGGDLKSFLRESRPQPGHPSPLVLKDLLQCALDVAKGCEYLEALHFIHRDIAARNCLLTTKGPGRVVKIADFGMARDIYRSNYYKKNGHTLLPVKWMPPEAFLDGIFQPQTDVWSFGVLLWEVMSLGYMPYPGRGNQEIISFVSNGGRLEIPMNCPLPVYRIMTQCWAHKPEDRLSFTTIIERLGYCIQDPDVTNAPLPVFQRPPSSERDTTIMRPSEEDGCIAVLRPEDELPFPASTDYLIPMSRSLSTVKTDLRSTPSVESAIDDDQIDDDNEPVHPSIWETSFNQEPPSTIAPRPPISINTPSSSHALPELLEEEKEGSPLLTSPTSSSPPLPPRDPDIRDRLLGPDVESTREPAGLRIPPKQRAKNNQKYYPTKYQNNGGSNWSSSGACGSSSTCSNASNSSSTTSTLPLNPASLPCIPPPMQYVNVDVQGNRSTDMTNPNDPYTIVETKEHREISC